MADLITDVPITTCYLRDEYLFDGQGGFGAFTPAQVFGLQSIAGRALLFMAMTDGGAVRDHLPLSAFCHKAGHAEHIPLEHLELWNAFSYQPAVHTFSYLQGLRARVCLKDRGWHWGTYEYTIDWYGNVISEAPGEGGHKVAHIFALDCGCYAAQPNHRVLWRESSFITRPFDPENLPRWRTNSQMWRVERDEKWITEHEGNPWFYAGYRRDEAEEEG